MLMQNPGLGAGTGYVPPKFGVDRNIDPEQIRQRMFLEKQREREEREKARTAGVQPGEDQGVDNSTNSTAAGAQGRETEPDGTGAPAEGDEAPGAAEGPAGGGGDADAATADADQSERARDGRSEL
jgi:hypothetical protein